MKVLLVHDYYQNRGGEDVAFDREAALLAATPGVEVVRWTKHNDVLRTLGPLARARLLATNAWSRSAASELRRVIAREKPDVAHAHNLWPLLSPSVLAALKDAGIPALFTAHNYYLFCLNGLFYRDGAVCTECFGRAPWPGVRHRCYRGVAGSITRTFGMLVFRRRRTFHEVDRILTPTEFARGFFLRAGFPPQRVLAKGLSVEDPWVHGAPAAKPFPEPASFVFASRLVPEKGGLVLLQALARMREPARLSVAGAGPQDAAMKAAAGRLGIASRVDFHGHLPHDRVRALMSGATAVVIPSTWFETFGFGTIESYSLGRPVVASDLGALQETVVQDVTGLRVPPGDPGALAAALDRLSGDPVLCARLGTAARARYEAQYTPARNSERLLAIYSQVLAERGA